MLTRRRTRTGSRAAAVVLAALVLTGVSAVPASAQGLFDLFGGGFRQPAPSLPAPTTSYADPFSQPSSGDRKPGEIGGGGPSQVYCVRTCDGRFFPLPRHAGSTPAELCRSFCPASKTMIFHGSKIDTATASNGMRYASLDNAFVYRQRVVEGCTCNGQDAFGLVRLEVSGDPTLKTGDIVATAGGFAAFKGRSTKSAEFTPVSPSTDFGRKLAVTKVAPALPKVEPPTPVNNDPPKRSERRRAQR